MRYSVLSLFATVLIACPNVYAVAQSSDELVDNAWHLWDSNDHTAVEAEFKAAMQADPDNIRPYLGLFYLYSLQERHDRAWEMCRRIFATASSPDPYVLALWTSPALLQAGRDSSAGLEQFYQEIREQGDPRGILRAMACEMLGYYYEGRRRFADSRACFDQLNAVTTWTVVGPFDNISASGHDKVFPPENDYQPAARYNGKNGVPATWFELQDVRRDRWIDMELYFAYTDAVFYANTFVFSPVKRRIHFRLGTSGSNKAWLNDEELINDREETNNDLDTYIVECDLQEGWNRILLKVGYSELERCNFLLRLTDEKGEALDGLRYSTAPQDYVIRPASPVKSIGDFAIEYFESRVDRHPGHIENYLLLADAYLRSEKSIEAELVLGRGLKRLPGCAALRLKLIEAYGESEKFDRAQTMLEEMYALDPRIPSIIDYEIDQQFSNEDFDKAELLIAELAEQLPESQLLLRNYHRLYTRKGQNDKARDIVRRAYDLFPADVNWMSAMATLSIRSSGGYDEAIALYRKYLETHFSEVVLMELAQLYRRKGEIDEWEGLYRQLIEYSPTTTGYFERMARVYADQERNDESIEAMLRAIAVCPNSTAFWEKLGDYYRATARDKEAEAAFQRSIVLRPTNYSAREKLRELRQKPVIFSNFEELAIDSLIARTPATEDYPNDNALIVLEDIKRVVYAKGCTEYMTDLLVKVFDQEGVDALKEYYVPYYRHAEALNIEKAVVIKQDGSEIRGDISGSYVVFKSLEPGDHVYLRWRVKNFYEGKLSEHFWDSHNFNGAYPVKEGRYALLVPEGFEFFHKTQNFDLEPSRRQSADGTVYRWRLQNEPGLVYEYGMPKLTDIGKYLHISTIPDWGFFVEWYKDLALAKTRSTYEIRTQIQELIAARSGALGKPLKQSDLSTEEKIELVYSFITENIRYSSVSFRQSGLTPQKAADVLETGIGDCKDVSTLAIAMLDELGVNAHYVLVNTRNEGANKSVLPSIAWNHCITAVESELGLRYLDLTANNFPIGAMPEFNMEAFCMLIKDGEKEPFYMERDKFLPRNVSRSAVVSVRSDNGIRVQTHTKRVGNLGAYTRFDFRHKGQKERERDILASIAGVYPNARLTRLEMEDLNVIDADVNYVYEYDVADYVMESGSYKILKLPWSDALRNDEALVYESREFDYNYWPYADTLVEILEINLPAGYEPLEVLPGVQLSSSVADYRIDYSFSNGVLRGTRTFINKQSVVSKKEYPAFKQFYNSVIKEDRRLFLLKRSGGVRP